MLEIKQVTKRYGSYVAIEDVSFEVPNGSVYGLVGYNGAGKTTLLKTVAGVLLPDSGEVLVDGESAYGKRTPERAPFIVADEPFFLPQATPKTMRLFYKGYYPHWSDVAFNGLMNLFSLDKDAKISGFSKGMQRQTAILLGLSTGSKTILLDESFDGLDLSKRILLKKLLRDYAQIRQASVILSSHNLRELEDVADYLGMINDHKLQFSSSIEEMRAAYPGKSLEEIFLEEEEVREYEASKIFFYK